MHCDRRIMRKSFKQNLDYIRGIEVFLNFIPAASRESYTA